MVSRIEHNHNTRSLLTLFWASNNTGKNQLSRFMTGATASRIMPSLRDLNMYLLTLLAPQQRKTDRRRNHFNTSSIRIVPPFTLSNNRTPATDQVAIAGPSIEMERGSNYYMQCFSMELRKQKTTASNGTVTVRKINFKINKIWLYFKNRIFLIVSLNFKKVRAK